MPGDPPTSADRRDRSREEWLSHLDALYGAALRMTGNRHDAEDLVQETYLKAVRSADRYREGSGCKPWLFRILTNTYIDAYRKAKRGPLEVEFDDEVGSGGFDGSVGSFPGEGPAEGALEYPGEVDDYLHRFVSDEVRRAIDELPEPFRELVVLRDLEGFSYRECAEMLAIPVGTVMSRLHRGRRTLRRCLRSYAAAAGYVPPAPAEEATQ